MPRKLIGYFTCLFFGLSVTTVDSFAFAQSAPFYGEEFRPGFHFSPMENWTNEPNGLIFHDGTYHLFYQANPFNNQFGNQSWGHAISNDLVHWQQQPIAIPGENGILSFSGSAVLDANNSTGLGIGKDGLLIAAFTGFIPSDGTQDQRLAFSNDGGVTWQKYFANPVLPRLPGVEGVESRDPKVFWHPQTMMWKMILAHGGQNKLSFWESPDLLSWTRTSDFFAPDISSQVSGWEVPDIFELPVINSAKQVVDSKWVLSATVNMGSPAGGNGVIYFVGEYDGTTFTNENPTSVVLWADYGRDFDGQQSWANLPVSDGRIIWTAVMQSYGESVPTTPWRGQMAIPRKLQLFDDGRSIRLRQTPIEELQALRGAPISLSNINIPPGTLSLSPFGISGNMLEIIAEFDPGTATSLGINVRQAVGGLETTIGYQVSNAQLFVDRTSSGNTNFSPAAGGVHFAPLEKKNGRIKIHTFVDRSTIEVFGNDGITVISDLIFSPGDADGISVFALGGEATLVSMDVYPMNSIWEVGDAPESGSSTIAKWSMDALPQAIGIPWLGPVSLDSKTLTGEGTQAGVANPFYEPNNAIENLWMFGERIMPTSPVVPPTEMFNSPFDGGESSFNAGALASSDNRGLHVPEDYYGKEFAFSGAFSIEMFFRTDIDRSNAGLMQLVLESDTDFRFGIIVNEGGPGNVRFAINDGAGSIPIVDMNSVTSRNYADANWHYLLAKYDPAIGTSGQLELIIANQDGSVDVATTELLNSFQGLKQTGGGNLLIGRHSRFLNSDPRNFLGLIDEVQITDGLISNSGRLGALPDELIFNTAEISAISVSNGTAITGEVQDILEDDDAVFVVQAAIPLDASVPPAGVLVFAEAENDSPDSLRLVIDSSSNTLGLLQSVELFDWTTGQFEAVGANGLETADLTISYDVTENPGRFVQAFTGQIFAKLQWKPNGPVLFFPWRSSIDKFEILYE